METNSYLTETNTLEVIKRLQEETQRLRNRLSDNESNPSSTSSPLKSPQKSPGHRSFEELEQVSLTFSTVEPPSEKQFKDPVSVREMSNHLKNEHEAFKQR